MWLQIVNKGEDKEIVLNVDKVVWCSFESDYSEDWQCDIFTCELSLVDGSSIISDSPQDAILALREYIFGERE